jgi:PAS domain-containing protein
MNDQLKAEIAERLQVEVQLRQSEEQLRQIIENLKHQQTNSDF